MFCWNRILTLNIKHYSNIISSLSVVQCRIGPAIDALSWHICRGVERACWTAGSRRCCAISTSWDRPRHWARRFRGSFVDYRRFNTYKSTQQICISITRAMVQLLINTHMLKLTTVHFKWFVSGLVHFRPRHWNCLYGTVAVEGAPMLDNW